MAAVTVPTDAVEPLGSVRRSQLVSGFGIGAIVDLEKGSFMPMGLDDWEGVTPAPDQSASRGLQPCCGSAFRLGGEDLQARDVVRATSAAPIPLP